MALQKRTHPGPRSFDAQTILLAGNCAIGATGAVGAVTGTGVTPTRTATGDYTLTINDTKGGVPKILAAYVSVEEDADVGYIALPRVSDASAGTVTCTVQAAATADTPADPPSGSFLHWIIVVKNSSIAR